MGVLDWWKSKSAGKKQPKEKKEKKQAGIVREPGQPMYVPYPNGSGSFYFELLPYTQRKQCQYCGKPAFYTGRGINLCKSDGCALKAVEELVPSNPVVIESPQ